MGPDPPDGAGPEHIPEQVHNTYHWEASEAEGGGWVGISSDVGSNGGGGLLGDLGLHHEEVEYGRSIYCDATDSGPL